MLDEDLPGYGMENEGREGHEDAVEQGINPPCPSVLTYLDKDEATVEVPCMEPLGHDSLQPDGTEPTKHRHVAEDGGEVTWGDNPVADES